MRDKLGIVAGTVLEVDSVGGKLVANNPFCDSSIQAIRKARSEGKLIVCECVVAEIFPTLENEDEITELMLDWQIHFVPLSLEGAMLASKHFSSYLERGGTHKRVLTDFLIGAHAMIHADLLIARGRGYLRDYFGDLELVDPSSD